MLGADWGLGKESAFGDVFRAANCLQPLNGYVNYQPRRRG